MGPTVSLCRAGWPVKGPASAIRLCGRVGALRDDLRAVVAGPAMAELGHVAPFLVRVRVRLTADGLGSPLLVVRRATMIVDRVPDVGVRSRLSDGAPVVLHDRPPLPAIIRTADTDNRASDTPSIPDAGCADDRRTRIDSRAGSRHEREDRPGTRRSRLHAPDRPAAGGRRSNRIDS